MWRVVAHYIQDIALEVELLLIRLGLEVIALNAQVASAENKEI